MKTERGILVAIAFSTSQLFILGDNTIFRCLPVAEYVFSFSQWGYGEETPFANHALWSTLGTLVASIKSLLSCAETLGGSDRFNYPP